MEGLSWSMEQFVDMMGVDLTSCSSASWQLDLAVRNSSSESKE